jgi:hopanoid biosynthesis associated radical SAM protein HpnH
MPIPVSQMWTVATYVLRQKLKGRKQYPLTLMLEPLFRCNLACAGCGKIQYPGHILKQHLTPEECFRAVDECGAPTVAIPGGEPLMHPQIDEIIAGIVARKKYVYMCTNALLLKQKLHLFKPSKYLSFSVHMDGAKDHHDLSVCKDGGYEIALEAIREAVGRGFRVTTNTTIFDGMDAQSMRGFFDEMMAAGVEGMMVSPGYSYEKAPDQQHFLGRDKTRAQFRKILSNRSKQWRFNMSPLFLEFLMGRRNFECTPWGMPTYNIFGWQKPCYLLQDGYAQSYQELLDSVDWSRYGYESGNPKCSNCMVHSGYEASAVNYTFSWKGVFATVRAMLDTAYLDAEALRQVEQEKPHQPLVQIDGIESRPTLQGSSFNRGNMADGVEQAFDYRGDVTLTLKNGERLEGYLFDREQNAKSGVAKIQLMLKADRRKVTVTAPEIEEISFTGRDMADGKSWAAWVKKYTEAKAAGVRQVELVPEAIEQD